MIFTDKMKKMTQEITDTKIIITTIIGEGDMIVIFLETKIDPRLEEMNSSHLMSKLKKSIKINSMN